MRTRIISHLPIPVNADRVAQETHHKPLEVGDLRRRDLSPRHPSRGFHDGLFAELVARDGAYALLSKLQMNPA